MGRRSKQKKAQGQKRESREEKKVDEFSKDISVDPLNLQVPGQTLLADTSLSLGEGRKYGLIGINGAGKTTLLKAIAKRSLPIPTKLDLLYVEQEVEASETMTVYETVFQSNRELFELSQRREKAELAVDEDDYEDEEKSDQLLEEYEAVEREWGMAGGDKAESSIRSILHGLSFTKEMQDTPTAHFSGGWRMRISLARALYLSPSLLMLDEPTNHLDAEATIWLTDYLSKWKKTLLLVSHDRAFLDDVVDEILHLREQKIFAYTGNYTQFQKQRANERVEAQKKWDNLQKKVKEKQKKENIKKEVARKMIADSGLSPPKRDYSVQINFPEPTEVGGHLVEAEKIDFGYTPEKILFRQLSFRLERDTRITLVGANGVGKSTFLKILAGELAPINQEVGEEKIHFNSRLKIGYYHQHSKEKLPLEMTPMEYLMSLSSDLIERTAREYLGRIGLSGKHHLVKMETLSGGQKARVAFCSLQVLKPHLLLLDEPTNHLDIESVQALIEAIQEFEGAVVMVTHDVGLVTETDSLLWELRGQKIYPTDYESYRERILEANASGEEMSDSPSKTPSERRRRRKRSSEGPQFAEEDCVLRAEA